MTGTITLSQLKKIYVLAKERGMDAELLHAHVWNLSKKESIKTLTLSEAIKVIDSLEGVASSKPGIAKPSVRQMNYIYGLMKKMGWVNQDGTPDADRLDGFLQNRFQIGSHKWLDKNIASKLIEAFKEMSERPPAPEAKKAL